ncbi:hypothetical protein LguiA_033242 [Lonicera macranthoides]
MESDSSLRIPVIDFSTAELDRRSEGWRYLSAAVREACEIHGCFEAVYDKITPQLQGGTFSVLKELFELPLEIKKMNVNPKPYHGYAGQYSMAPLYESFGIEDALEFKSMEAFVQLMFPHGNEVFCNNLRLITEPMDELKKMIEMSILDSYDLGEKYLLDSSIMTCKTLLRITRYKAPPNGEYMNGLNAHTDKPLSALLCSNQTFGLEIETKDGKWIQFFPSPNSFIFIVGDPLMAWSNGRFHAAKHRVMMKGHEERYSLAAFQVPIEGTIVKPPKEFVDEENYPQIFKEFNYMDFITFSYSKEGMAIESAKQLFSFAAN